MKKQISFICYAVTLLLLSEAIGKYFLVAYSKTYEISSFSKSFLNWAILLPRTASIPCTLITGYFLDRFKLFKNILFLHTLSSLICAFSFIYLILVAAGCRVFHPIFLISFFAFAFWASLYACVVIIYYFFYNFTEDLPSRLKMATTISFLSYLSGVIMDIFGGSLILQNNIYKTISFCAAPFLFFLFLTALSLTKEQLFCKDKKIVTENSLSIARFVLGNRTLIIFLIAYLFIVNGFYPYLAIYPGLLYTFLGMKLYGSNPIFVTSIIFRLFFFVTGAILVLSLLSRYQDNDYWTPIKKYWAWILFSTYFYFMIDRHSETMGDIFVILLLAIISLTLYISKKYNKEITKFLTGMWSLIFSGFALYDLFSSRSTPGDRNMIIWMGALLVAGSLLIIRGYKKQYSVISIFRFSLLAITTLVPLLFICRRLDIALPLDVTILLLAGFLGFSVCAVNILSIAIAFGLADKYERIPVKYGAGTIIGLFLLMYQTNMITSPLRIFVLSKLGYEATPISQDSFSLTIILVGIFGLIATVLIFIIPKSEFEQYTPANIQTIPTEVNLTLSEDIELYDA